MLSQAPQAIPWRPPGETCRTCGGVIAYDTRGNTVRSEVAAGATGTDHLRCWLAAHASTQPAWRRTP